jgi:hypothetical protein
VVELERFFCLHTWKEIFINLMTTKIPDIFISPNHWKADIIDMKTYVLRDYVSANFLLYIKNNVVIVVYASQYR